MLLCQLSKLSRHESLPEFQNPPALPIRSVLLPIEGGTAGDGECRRVAGDSANVCQHSEK
jgi:hypothetical protein